jgi:hypothetical protein
MTTDAEHMAAIDVDVAVGAIHMILADRPAQEQGMIIAMLTARWLASHMAAGDPKATAKLRKRLLTVHVAAVRSLIPHEEAEMLAGLRKRSH